VLTIFNVLLLFFFYEIVAYGMATMINWNRVISIIYGLVIVILGILCIVLENRDMEVIAQRVWAALSTNQKDYFKNDIGNLKDERRKNNLFVGLFSIAIGLCFVSIGALMFKLHQLQAPSIVKQVTARLPVMSRSECVEFKGSVRNVEKHLDQHYMAIMEFFPQVDAKKLRTSLRAGDVNDHIRDEENGFDLVDHEQDEEELEF